MWLNIIAISEKSVAHILHDHWQEFGRNYYSRHDYEGVDKSKASAVMAALEDKFNHLPGRSFHGETVSRADSFAYTDPVDGSISENQGLRVEFESGSRFVIRLSGTGTVGATLRLYIEKYVAPPTDLSTADLSTDDLSKGGLYQDTQIALKDLAALADDLGQIKTTLGRKAPSVIS